MPSYVTLPEFKAYIVNQLAATDDADLTAALNAAERAAESFCARSFTTVASATRLYAPCGSEVLRIHDCTTVTSVTVSGTLLAGSAYQLEPLNLLSWSGQARPVEQIRLLSSAWSLTSEATVSVVATWGWTAVPDQIKEAVRLTAKDILLQRNVNSGVVGGDFAFTARLNPYVKTLLAPLRRVEAFGIA